jgi:hypothetical protein
LAKKKLLDWFLTINNYRTLFMKKRAISCVVAMCLGTSINPAFALNVGGGVGVSVEHSDNISKEHIDEESDTERNVGVDLKLDHSGDRIQANLNYSITRIDYQDNTYDDETAKNGSALLNLELVEDMLNWKVANTTNYSQVSSKGEDTEDNRTNRNMFSTGPELLLPLGKVDLLTARALYQDIRFDNNVDSSDNERLDGSLDWSHFLADQRRVSIGVSREEVDFDERTNNDYDKDRYYVGFASEAGYLTYDFVIGKDKVKPDFGEDTDGDFRQIGVVYTNSDHSFAFHHDNQLTDSTVGLSAYSIFAAQGINPDAVKFFDENGREIETSDINFELAQVVERTRNELSYSSPDYNGVQFSAVVYKDEQDYKDSLNDEHSRGYDLSVNYKMTESLRFSLGYNNEKTEFDDEPLLGEDEEERWRLGVVYDLNKEWSVNAWYIRDEQTNDTDSTREYDENRVAIGLRYSFD